MSMQDNVNGEPQAAVMTPAVAMLEQMLAAAKSGKTVIDSVAIVVVDPAGTTISRSVGPRQGDLMNGLDMLKMRLLAAVMGFELKPIQRSGIVRAPAGLVGG